MANTIQNLIDKGINTFNCKLYGQKIFDSRPGCMKCAKSYTEQHSACIAAVKAVSKAKTKTDKTPVRIPGLWGYATGSFTDIFCNAIAQKPLTMNQAAAIIAPCGEPIGPHPKCKKRLISEGLACFEDGKIYMRVWPKGHSEAGKLTPAAKIARSKNESKTESKAA
jgi:hypothetical protein